MEEYAAIGVDLIEVTPRADDPAKWIADFASQVVTTMAELGRSFLPFTQSHESGIGGER